MKTYRPPKIVRTSTAAKAPSGRRIVGKIAGKKISNPTKSSYQRLVTT